MWSRAALWTLVVVFGLVVAAAVVIWSGVYNVAATRGHFPLTAKILEIAMRQSVKAHSWHLSVPPLDDPDMVRLGASHYHGGCAPCHGAPGDTKNPIVQHMLPPPTPLASAVNTWSAKELFWIVKNGVKYTGMPAWVAFNRDDEVWAVVAFLRRLPTMNGGEYRALALGNADQDSRMAHEILDFGTDAATISACSRCHDDGTAAPQSRLVPKLAAQSADYLKNALKDYAAGHRQSGIMQPIAAELDEQEILQLSNHYANLVHRARPQRAFSPQIERGRVLATAGIPQMGIPPCLACHGANSLPSYPRLAGQYRAYLRGQLLLFKKGVRTQTAQSAIMTTIARRLSDGDIEDAAEFFEQLPFDATQASLGTKP